MKNHYIVYIKLSLIIVSFLFSCKNITIPKIKNKKDINGFSEYGVYFELGSDKTYNDTLINIEHSKIYSFKINSVDSVLIDLSNYYSKEEFVNMTSPYVSFISICGYDFNGQNDDVGWNQSPLFFQYLNKKYEVVVSEQTGFVENSINFWMHPPRQDKFMQNYTAPWPMVVYNKSQWNWEFVFNGTGWQNIVKKEWRDTAKFLYTYNVCKKELKKIEGKYFDCYNVQASGESKVGNSSADFLFCNNFGIFEYSCVNIDGSTLHLLFDRYDTCLKQDKSKED